MATLTPWRKIAEPHRDIRQAFNLLARLVEAGKLEAVGEKRGRRYIPPGG